MMPCCMATRWARTSGTEATALTALDTCRVRIWVVTSVPSTLIAGLPGSVLTSMTGCWAWAATASALPTGTPWCSIHQVRARYMAPVSR